MRDTQPTTPEVEIGHIIPRRVLITIHNERIEIPDSHRLTHLQFRRFAGCGSCNLHLRSFAKRHAEISAANIREVAVFYSTAESMMPHQGELPFAIVSDPSRTLYEEFGVKTNLRSILAPSAWLSWVGAAFALDKLPEPPREGESKLGLPADFLMATDGRVLALKYGTHAYDQWSVDELLSIAATKT